MGDTFVKLLYITNINIMDCVYDYDSKFYSRSDMYVFIYPKSTTKTKVYEDVECNNQITINEFLERNSPPTNKKTKH